MNEQPKGKSERLQDSLEAVMASCTTPPALLATLFELKLRKRGVRLTDRERKHIRTLCDRYFDTQDPSIFDDAVKRSRNIRIRFTDRDFKTLSRIVTQAVECTVNEMTRQLTKTLDPQLHTWADHHSACLLEEYAAFQLRTQQLWAEPFGRFARFRSVAAHAGELALERLREKGMLNTSRLATALVFLHARACLVAGEVDVLMHMGYPDGASARWRTLHEIAVTAAFLFEYGEETAKRYLAHFACEDWKAAQTYEKHRRKLGYGTLGKRYLRALEAEVTKLRQQYGDEFRNEYGWALHALGRTRVTFAEIEEAVKLPFMRPFYKLASEQVHASPRGAIARGGLIDQKPWEAALLTGPSNYGFADTGMNSAHALLLVTASLCSVEAMLDTNVLMLLMTKWLDPLKRSFVKVQRGIEMREARQAEHRRARERKRKRRGNRR